MGAKNAGGRDDRSDPEVERLIEEGLERYGRGDLEGALQAWEKALWLYPDEPRAVGYVDYLRSNYQLLTGGAASSAELAVPFGLASLDDDAAYEVEIVAERSGGPLAAPGAWAPAVTPEGGLELRESVDDGWFLDDDSGITAVSRPLPLPVPRSPRRPGATGEFDFSDSTGEQTNEIRDRALGFVRMPDSGASAEEAAAALGRSLPGVAWSSADANTAEMRMRISSDVEPSGSTDAIDLADVHDDLELEISAGNDPAAPSGDDELTLERGGWGSKTTPGPRTVTFNFDDGEPHSGTEPPLVIVEDPVLADASSFGTIPRAGGDDDSDEFDADVATAERSRMASLGLAPIGRADKVSMEVVAHDILTQLERAAPAGESSDERIRRRISSLLEKASYASGAGHHPIAVTAVDLALSEDPDSAVAQKLIHRNRESILAIYQQFIGNLAARPALAIPMHELSREDLDSRAAFLLSRVDGTLAFEEILDIAGMSRLEAFRYLSRMLLRGILEVR